MTPRRLFIVILVLSLTSAACASTILYQPTPVLPPPSVVTVTPALVSSPTAADQVTLVPSAEAGDNNSTAAPPTPHPVQIPDPAAYEWAQVVTGITAPTDIKNAGDGSGRLFILEKPGRIRVLKDGQLLGSSFLDITDRVGSDSSEQGLLGLTFHPQFTQNGYFYVNYTDKNGNTHVARFVARGDIADPFSEQQLLSVKQPFANHNGGSLAFGPDGYLYIGLGDGGSAGDPFGNGQSLNTRLGKILRIDVNTVDTPYGIPPDNPFTNIQHSEIWAYGLRNPWRFSFDGVTGDLWIGDVGQNSWEEIDFVAAGTPGGVNFGWNKMEATHPFNGANSDAFTGPVAEYSHNAGCSVTGGYVYRGAALPEWQGVYLFGDYCFGTIWGLTSPPGGEPVPLFQTGFSISTFGVDEAEELYVADYNGTIYRLEKRR